LTDVHRVALLLTCLEGQECAVVLEPLGTEHTLNHNDVFSIELQGSGDGEVEIGFHRDGLSVHAWPGARITLKNRVGETLEDVSP